MADERNTLSSSSAGNVLGARLTSIIAESTGAKSGNIDPSLTSPLRPLQPIPEPPGNAVWQLIHSGKESGPFQTADLIEKADCGEIDPDDLLRESGGIWTKASEIPWVKKRFRLKRESRKQLDIRLQGAIAIGGFLLLFFGGLYYLFRPDAETYRVRAVAASRNGDHDLAIKYFDENIRHDPNDGWAYYLRGNEWLHKKDYDRAIKDYDEAVRLGSEIVANFGKSNYSNVLIARGNARSDKNEHGKAIKDYNEAIQLNPSWWGAYFNRGNAWGKLNEYDRAIRDYDEAIRLNREDAATFYQRGNAWTILKQSDKAIKDYNEAIQLKPEYAQAFNMRGLTWWVLNDCDKAIKDFDEAIRLDPENALMYQKNRLEAERRKFNR